MFYNLKAKSGTDDALISQLNDLISTLMPQLQKENGFVL